ncbi:MAG: hypothetical protein IVW53_06125 [Chloroflexi bacterium]|nr:hypothetical protein [Chloroflexota bacterium]
MQPRTAVQLEVAAHRAFASALEWPGWCRSGRDEATALAALIAVGPRYRTTVGRTAADLTTSDDTSRFEIVERTPGTATTDFGAPGVPASTDDRPIDAAELDRLSGLLRACWTAFDAVAVRHASAVLRSGPRGGGRVLATIVDHVDGADRAYLGALGGAHHLADDVAAATSATQALRAAFLATLVDRASRVPPPPSRRRNPVWSVRYAIRRSAWHAVDHAWEIEDRVTPAP